MADPPDRSVSTVSLSLFRPLERFVRVETRAGTAMMLATLAALFLANSSNSAAYFKAWATPVSIHFGNLAVDEPLLFWVNDFLMAAFFLLVGLEIKRELLTGELNSARKAALPLLAALGGMLVPAALYVAVAGGSAPAGWGVPMATDIAFAIGVARLLGGRVPAPLLVFLTAFAIADDLGAVAVIALFYGHAVHWGALGVAAAVTGGLIAMNMLGVRLASAYVLVGLMLWGAILSSGIHPTLAGVVVGLCVPASHFGREAALASADAVIELVRGHEDQNEAALEAIERTVDDAQSPLWNLEHGLHPYVAYGIVPLFAFANAGIDVRGLGLGAVLEPVSLGIVLGLVVGKPIGILSASWLAVRAGIAELPAGVTWRHLAGAGILGGIGFTMSLFVAGLAFAGSPALFMQAKLGILVASICAAGLGVLALGSIPAPRDGAVSGAAAGVVGVRHNGAPSR